MTLNVKNIEDRMQLMHDNELQQFASMHKNDPYVLPLALQEADRRKKYKVAEGMKFAGQQQPTVADQALQQMSPQPAPQQQPMPPQAGMLPEEQGIGNLPAQNIVGMADGGIAGYAEGSKDAVTDTSAYRKYAIEKARKMGLNPRFVDSLFRVESTTKKHPEGYDPHAKSKTGPAGIGQLTKATAQAYGLTPAERFNPYKNMDASLAHIADLNKKYNGDEAKIAVAYNQGEGYLNAHLRENKGKLVPAKLSKDEPKNYLTRIFKLSQAPEGTIPKPVQAMLNPVMPGREAVAGELSSVPQQSRAPAAAGIMQLPDNISERGSALAGRVNGPAVYPPIKEPGSSLSGKVNGPVVRAPVPVKPATPVYGGGEWDAMGNFGGATNANTPDIGTKSPVTSTLTSIADVPIDAVTGLIGELSRGVSRPFMSLEEANKYRGMEHMVSHPLGKLFGVAEDPAYTQGPVGYGLGKVGEAVDYLSKKGADFTGMHPDDVANIINVLPFVAGKVKPIAGKVKPVEYNVPTKKAAPAPIDAGLAALTERAKQGAIDAAAARAKVKQRPDTQTMPLAAEPVRPVQGELFPETLKQPEQMVLPGFEAPGVKPVKPVKPGEFPIAPETIKWQEKAAEVRNQQSKVAAALAERRAKEAAEAQKRLAEKLEEQKGKKGLGETVVEKVGEVVEPARKATEVAVGAAASRDAEAAQAGVLPPSPEPIDLAAEAQAWRDRYKKGPETFDTQVEDASKTKAAGAALAPQAAAKEGTGLTNDDYLTMGLNMLQAGPGTGNAISDLASNVGRSGLATLASRKEREKTAAEKQFKDIYSKYYTGMTEQLGKPTGEERIMDRYMNDPKFAAAYDSMQYARGTTQRENALLAAYQKELLMRPDLTWEQYKLEHPEVSSAGLTVNPSVLPTMQKYIK